MDKKEMIALWRTDLDDDAAIARMVAAMEGFEKCKPQHVRHWRLNGKNPSKYDDAILKACAERFRFRVRVPGMVVMEMPAQI